MIQSQNALNLWGLSRKDAAGAAIGRKILELAASARLENRALGCYAMLLPFLIIAQPSEPGESSLPFFVIFSIFPYHLARASIFHGLPELYYCGTLPTIIQAAVLGLFFLAMPRVFRSKKIPYGLKMLYVVLGYPLLTFATNMGTSIFW